MRSYLDFEKPVAELEAKVEELRALGENRDAVSITDDISRLEVKAADALKELVTTGNVTGNTTTLEDFSVIDNLRKNMAASK